MNRYMVDATAGGTLMSKTHEEAYELLEELASNNYQWPSKRSRPKAHVVELDSISLLATHMVNLYKQLDKMNVNVIQANVVCDHCASNH